MNTALLIGRNVKVTCNKVAFNGKVIDETRNMLLIKTEKGVKRIIKKCATIHADNLTLNGKDITKRPQDRIKK